MEDKKFSLQYINMCKEGQIEIEAIRPVITANKDDPKFGWIGANFPFNPGDYFHYPEMESDDTKIVEEVSKRNIRAANDPSPFEREKCIWIPTADQLEKEAQELPWALYKNVAKTYYEDQSNVLASLPEEEYTLAYYMEHKCGKAWDSNKQKWINIISKDQEL